MRKQNAIKQGNSFVCLKTTKSLLCKFICDNKVFFSQIRICCMAIIQYGKCYHSLIKLTTETDISSAETTLNLHDDHHPLAKSHTMLLQYMLLQFSGGEKENFYYSPVKLHSIKHLIYWKLVKDNQIYQIIRFNI